jgi:malate/lactate dehydrogenase
MLEIPLSKEELASLKKSAEKLRNIIDSVVL